MAYDEWDEREREFFDDLPVTSYLTPGELADARDIFEEAFLQRGHDLSWEARDEWWEFTGMEPQDFNWTGWREMMGYQ
jgi:hypothetical protein